MRQTMVLLLFGAMASAFLTFRVVESAWSGELASIVQRLETHEAPITSELLDRDGRVIAGLSAEDREWIPISSIPMSVQQAFLAAEDRNFYQHLGVSATAVLRAFLANLRSKSFKQGASTLTQQVVRMMHLAKEKSLERKLKEALLAIMVERRVSKDVILENYLNRVFLGNFSYGVSAASQNYFRKKLQDLNIAEAALLAGLPPAPSRYAANRHFDLAKKRQRYVLRRMMEDGYLSREDQEKWEALPLKVAPEPRFQKAQLQAPFFQDHAKRELERLLDDRDLQLIGLRVQTTLEEKVQDLLENFVAESANEDQEAMIAVDTRTGAILGLVGGRDFQRNQVNLAAQQPIEIGSLLNPYLVAFALEQDFELTTPIGTSTPWEFLGSTSSNQRDEMILELKPQDLAEFLRKAGLIRDLNEARTTLLRLAVSFASLINGGWRRDLTAIESVTSAKGEALYSRSNRQTRLLSNEASFILREALPKRFRPLALTAKNGRNFTFLTLHSHYLIAGWHLSEKSLQESAMLSRVERLQSRLQTFPSSRPQEPSKAIAFKRIAAFDLSLPIRIK